LARDILARIDDVAVEVDFKVYVRPGRCAGTALVSENGGLVDVLADLDGCSIHMAVYGRDAAAMIDDNMVAQADARVDNFDDFAGFERMYRRHAGALAIADINAGVFELVRPIRGAKFSSDGPMDGPDCRPASGRVGWRRGLAHGGGRSNSGMCGKDHWRIRDDNRHRYIIAGFNDGADIRRLGHITDDGAGSVKHKSKAGTHIPCHVCRAASYAVPDQCAGVDGRMACADAAALDGAASFARR
jgi:hypothetical protein